ncbi:SnoaL-like polyketide cyclase [Halobiforma haloterrestris]|uniref:SnoaL-like polyketide cyclase n=1 Tax=Natronobacterium haloterrestre TaxID=148448 RepID=A0A1I1LIK4_NATHA|nr:SnoaL-like polyketide cyclase [Halobiforma haloterrestris]
MRRFVDVRNERGFATEGTVADDAVRSAPTDSPDAPRGPEGEKRRTEGYHAAFPDVSLEVENLLAEDDLVAVRWTATGTE